MAIYFSCCISNCGQLLLVVPQQSGTAPAGGFDELIATTAVSGVPTLHKNGTPLSIGPATWGQGAEAYGTGTAVGFLTASAVLSSDVLTVDIPANFVNGSSPAYTAVPVWNFTGQLEGPFGAGVVSGATGCPGINATPTMKFAAEAGAAMSLYDSSNFIVWNQVLRADGWQWAPGSSGAMTQDEYRNLLSWAGGQTIRLPCCIFGGSNGLDGRGIPNQPGDWTLVVDDFGTIASTFSLTETTGNGTVTLVSSSVSGTTHTLIFNIQYASSNPTAWQLSLWINIAAPANNTGLSDGLSHWAYGQVGTANSPFLSPPDMVDGTALTVDRSQPFAINPNVATQISGGGNTADFIRCMESLTGASLNNKVYLCDLPSVLGFWPTQRTLGPITFNHVRFANTNPAKGSIGSGGDGTYNWAASTRVYGPQGDFALNDGGTTAITATLTAGKHAITITAGTPLLAGGLITGTGIAAGTRLASFSGSSGWLEQPATASGSQSLTLANPGYLAISAGDDGAFMIAGFGAQNWAVAEMRSDAPHGLSTGYLPGGTAVNTTHGNAVTVTQAGSVDPGSIVSPIYVTGPYTIMTTWPINGGSGSNPQTIVPTTEYDFTGTGGWEFGVIIPYDPHVALPYEALAAIAAGLGGNCWLNLPGWGTDALYGGAGQMAYAYGAPSTIFRLEIEDEPWNGGPPFDVNVISRLARQNLYGQQAPGTVISEYFTAAGRALPFAGSGLAQNALLTGHAANVFESAYRTAGGAAGRVQRVINSQYVGPGATSTSIGALQCWGVPADWIALAPYISTPTSASITTAFAAAGGNWPLSAINDHTRLSHAYNYQEQLYYLQHMQVIQSWGQPDQPLTATVGGSGGSLTPSYYLSLFTYLDSSGNESTAGASQSPSTINVVSNGQVITLSMQDGTPSWVHSLNIYIAFDNGTAWITYLCDNVPASTPPGTGINITSLVGSPHSPPGASSVPQSTSGIPPGLLAYEGGDQQPIPITLTTDYFGNPEWIGLTHDVLAHTSRWLSLWTYLASNQIGCQWLPGSGLASSAYFGVWSNPGPDYPALGLNNEWIIYAAVSQVPGLGASNQFALRGAPADGQDHNGGAPLSVGFNGVPVANQCPSGYGVQRWIAGTVTPIPTPTSTSARRALPGLRAIP